MADRVHQNVDGSTRIDKTTTAAGTLFLTRQPIEAINRHGPDGSEVPLRDGKLSIMTIHARGHAVREVVIAMGSSEGSAFFLGSPDAAEHLVQQLQFCIARARALMQGGGVA